VKQRRKLRWRDEGERREEEERRSETERRRERAGWRRWTSLC